MTIKINSTDNVGLFEPPKFQELSLIIKSLPLFQDIGLQVTNEDIFTWDKEDDNYILLHHNLKYDEEKALFAISDEMIRKIDMKTLHQEIINIVNNAWCEYLI